jgi:hypothetical protein
LDESASLTRLETELGPRGKSELPGDGDGEGVVHDGDGTFPPPPLPTLHAPDPVPLPPVLPPPPPVTAPRVRRRAIEANVSSSPAVADVSIVLVPAADVKFGTLTLIEFDTETEPPLGSSWHSFSLLTGKVTSQHVESHTFLSDKYNLKNELYNNTASDVICYLHILILAYIKM